MYGGPSKLGSGARGGGGGSRNNPAAAKRHSTSLPPPPPHRPTSTTNRLSLGGTPPSNLRNRSSTAINNSASAASAEENFSLMPGNNPPAFAMIIRLAPDLVDEIRRVEAQGGNPKIKFDSMGNNPSGNVIDVGGKEFRFTWSREFGDLCDIYEERQSGEDGNGLLVESGSAWRKVNVQRILDESTKNHVKMRSEEAERKLKSRKAIVLDHGNPAAKSQLKQLAAVESNPWKNFKQKKEPPFKKRKVDPPAVTAASISKSTFKPGFTSTPNTKGRRSSSPLSSPPEQSCGPGSPFGTGSNSKSHIGAEGMIPMQMKSKENAASARSDKEIPTKVTTSVTETPGLKSNLGAKPMDLQSLLITLLTQNPKGLSLKALEKAVGDAFPNSAKKIEPIIKKIATFQAPGRYFLKQEVELGSFRRRSSESGSSPEDNHLQTLPPENNHDQRPTPEPKASNKNPSIGLEEQAQPNSQHEEECNALEKIDIQQPSPDVLGEEKISDHNEGQAASSSDSGSDSDSESDSSDSGSDSGSHSRSRSRSRSRSPVGSGSGSSSDSESDASSNSKEGSDEDVDIMTSDDDKEPQHKQQSEPAPSTSPDPWRSVQTGTEVVQDGDGSDAVDIEGHQSDAIDIEKDMITNEEETEVAINGNLAPSKEGERPADGEKSSFGHDRIQECQNVIGNLFDDNENNVGDSFRYEQSDSSERISKGRSKRGPDVKHLDEKSERAKRWKVETLAQAPICGGKDAQSSESPHGRHIEDTYKGAGVQLMNRADREGNTDFRSQRGYNQAIPGKSSTDLQQSGRRSSDHGAWSKAPDTAVRSKHAETSGHGRKLPEKSSHVREAFPTQREKTPWDNQNEDNFGKKERKMPRNQKEGGAGSRHSAPFEPHHKKQGEVLGKFKDSAQVLNSHIGSSPKDNNRGDANNYPVARGKGLQRELSDLELGELREPLSEEVPIKKQFERKDSFKHSENKPSTSGNCSSDLGKGKPVGKVTVDHRRPSPNLSSGVKRLPEHQTEDLTRLHHKVVHPHTQQLSRVDNAEVGSQTNKLADTNGRLRQTENGTKQGNGAEGCGESLKKAPVSGQLLHDPKNGVVAHSVKDSKTQESNLMADLVDGRKDTILTEINHDAQKRRESSLEEDSTSFSKYEKEVPDLKEPIKDFAQYKEYVQEYRDKYDGYCSLNRILESYRNEFQKLGNDLQFAKGRDMDRYHKILLQLKESYHQCGARHKRLKRIFVVLHKELEHLKQRIKDFALSYTKD